MEQQPYMEDRMSMLDIGKQFASASFNPLLALRYNPNSWSPLAYNGVRVGGNVGRRGGLINNKYTRGMVNYVGSNIFGMDREIFTQDDKLAKYFTKKRHNKINRSLNKYGMHYTDGYIGLNLGASKDSTIGKWAAKVIKDNDGSSANIKRIANAEWKKAAKPLLAQYDDITTQINEAVIKRTSAAKGFSSGIHVTNSDAQLMKELVSADDVLDNLTSQRSAVFSQIKDARGLKLSTKAVAKSARYSRGLAHVAAFANGTGRMIGKLGWKGLMVGGKLNAYVAVGSLMYEGIKMIANPIGQASANAVDNAFSGISSLAKLEGGGQLGLDFISQGAATERQRAMSAISRSRMNGRSALGNEAQYMHN